MFSFEVSLSHLLIELGAGAFIITRKNLIDSGPFRLERDDSEWSLYWGPLWISYAKAKALPA